MNKKALLLCATLLATVMAPSNTLCPNSRVFIETKDLCKPLPGIIASLLIIEFLYHFTDPVENFKSRFSTDALYYESYNALRNTLKLKLRPAYRSMKEVTKQIWYYIKDEISGQKSTSPTVKVNDNSLIVSKAIKGYGKRHQLEKYIKTLESLGKSLVAIASLQILGNKLIAAVKSEEFSEFLAPFRK